jgi:antirestriction protein
MIEITLREHGLHNGGYSIDIPFDLSNYTNSEDMVQELIEESNEWIMENLENKDYYLNGEEWLITDIEIDSEYIGVDAIRFDEYMSLDTLIKLNKVLEEDESNQIAIALLLESGKDLEDAIDKKDDMECFEIADMTFKNADYALGEYLVHNCEDFGLEIPDFLTSYINYERFGREYGMDYTTYTFKNGKMYGFREY